MEFLVKIKYRITLWFLISSLLIYSCGEKKEQDKSAIVIATGITNSTEGEVWLKKYDSTLVVLKTPDTSDGLFETADLSPNKQFVLITAPLGDGGQAWIYSVKEAKLYEIDGGYGMGHLGWLEDNRIILHQGCIIATYCKKLISISNSTPWILEVSEDLSKEEQP